MLAGTSFFLNVNILSLRLLEIKILVFLKIKQLANNVFNNYNFKNLLKHNNSGGGSFGSPPFQIENIKLCGWIITK